ncbi:hypothetical protein C8Q79DRAFT_1008741 [Trametes meyenii]|nr:hypothetical protein C8Q79DRAFT_1008741 [Trametes meyenii]
MASYMPLRSFLATFIVLPGHDLSLDHAESKPHIPHEDVLPLEVVEGERDLAVKFASLVNEPLNGGPNLCPGLKVALPLDKWDLGDLSGRKVDGALFPQDDAPDDGQPHWAKQTVLIQFRLGSEDDLYAESVGSGDDKERVKLREGLSAYVGHVLTHQQRTALFVLLLHGTKMRLTRWDRAGTLFTEPFDYVEQPKLLRDIMWGLSSLSLEEQGIDTTATALKPGCEEYKLMDELALPQDTDLPEDEGESYVLPSKKTQRVFAYVRNMFASSLEDGWQRWKLLVPTKKGKPSKAFLVGKPSFVAPEIEGRGTRGYVAVDCESRRFVFLKDVWRPHDERVEVEGEVLRKLRRTGVKNVPTLVCDAELDQETWHSPYPVATSTTIGGQRCEVPRPPQRRCNTVPLAGGSRPIPPKPLRHYRIVVEEVCMPLSSFKTGRQLVSIIRDCIQAHEGAFCSGGRILHRDIGVGNILILPEPVKLKDGMFTSRWRGMLTDWELSKSVPWVGELSREGRPARIGTWQSFNSARSLDYPHAPVQVEDELESFFHVLYYNALRYLRNSCPNVPVAVAQYFDTYEATADRLNLKCGPVKRYSMQTGSLQTVGRHQVFFVDENGKPLHPLNGLLWEALSWFSARYIKAEYARSNAVQYKFSHLIVPTEYDGLAKKLETHQALKALLDKALLRAWPDDDKVGDQLEGGLIGSSKDPKPIRTRKAPSLEESPKKRVKKSSLRSIVRGLGL